MNDPTVTQSVYWAQIPEWVLFHPDLQGQDVRVFGALQRYANASAECWPGLQALAQKCRCSMDTVRRSITRLAQVGAVVVETRNDDAGRQTSNRYRLQMHKAPSTAATHPPSTSARVPLAPVLGKTESLEPEPFESNPPTPRDNSRAPLSERGEEVIEVIMRTVASRAGEVRDRTRWTATVRQRLTDEHGAAIERLVERYPHAHPTVIAGHVLGESNNLRYYASPSSALAVVPESPE